MACGKVHLAIINIISWAGQCADAEHVYGHLILSTNKEVTVDNVEEYNVKYLGNKIELKREISLAEAIALDAKDQTGGAYEYDWNMGNKDTVRFKTFSQVVEAGVKAWRALGIDCPLISLYEGEKYYANEYEPSDTVIIMKREVKP